MKKILLVDDKANIGRVLKIYLGTEYDLEYFESPLKALEWLEYVILCSILYYTLCCILRYRRIYQTKGGRQI